MRMLARTLILLSTSIEAFAVLGTHHDCSSIWNENKQPQQRKTGRGALRLSLLNLEHPCSPVRHEGSLSWHRSRSLERERQLAARLLFRRRGQEPATEISAPVTIAGAYYGFVAQVALGTPPTRQTVLIDTAASFSWVQCEPCGGTGTAAGCFDQDGPRFNPDDSTTYRKTPCLSPSCLLAVGNTSAPGHCSSRKDRCIYYMKYMDGSASVGLVGTDTLTFGDVAIPGFVFGSSNLYSGVFGRYSGTFGFAATGKLSILSQVAERTGRYRAFSYYLPSPTSVGYIQVGAYDEDELEFTPMFTNGSDYYLGLTGITVDGYSLELTGSSRLSPQTMAVPCYLDLGTSFTVLPNQMFQKLRDAVAERIKGYDRVQSTRSCFEPAFLSGETVIPAVEMHFRNGVRLRLDQNKLMYKGRDGRVCLGFASGDMYMLGSMQMQMIYAAQDVEKSRMGFSRS